MQGLQSQKISSRACGGCGLFLVPDDSSIVVVSSSNGEISFNMVSGNHFVMCDGSHQFKVTVCDHLLWVSESE